MAKKSILTVDNVLDIVQNVFTDSEFYIKSQIYDLEHARVSTLSDFLKISGSNFTSYFDYTKTEAGIVLMTVDSKFIGYNFYKGTLNRVSNYKKPERIDIDRDVIFNLQVNGYYLTYEETLKVLEMSKTFGFDLYYKTSL